MTANLRKTELQNISLYFCLFYIQRNKNKLIIQLLLAKGKKSTTALLTQKEQLEKADRLIELIAVVIQCETDLSTG